MIDSKKAFNSQNHANLVTKLGDMGVPGWLLKIMVGFLTDREGDVIYKGETSERKKMPGSSPQGRVLGMFLCLVLINNAGFDEEDRNLGEQLTRPVNAKTNMRNLHLKYVDDLTIAEAMKLKKCAECGK